MRMRPGLVSTGSTIGQSHCHDCELLQQALCAEDHHSQSFALLDRHGSTRLHHMESGGFSPIPPGNSHPGRTHGRQATISKQRHTHYLSGLQLELAILEHIFEI